jgi:hypothetical protein
MRTASRTSASTCPEHRKPLACYNRGPIGACAACLRRLPLKDGYCCLCWCQARHDRAVTATDARLAVVLAPWLPQVRHHQLFFAGMDNRRAAPRALPRRYGEKGRPRKPPPPMATRPASDGTQLALFAALPARDYRQVRFDLLAGHRDGETIAASAMHAVARRHSISSQNVIEILATMEIASEDRPDLFASWLDAKLTVPTDGLAREARRWAVTLQEGGPRTRARSPGTAQAYLRAALPALAGRSARCDHLGVRSPRRRPGLHCGPVRP